VPSRRAFLLSTSCLASAAIARRLEALTPSSEDLEVEDLRLEGDPKIARRALLLRPRPLPPGTKLPLLVLLHGLGETGNELLGIHAWGDRYGLVRAYERLKRPPVARLLPRQHYLTDERLFEINRALSLRPFQGLCLVCPVTPNPYRLVPAERTLDRYAAWLTDVLLPAVRRRAQVSARVGLDGCSLGGYVAIEVFLRRPAEFSSVGSVQGAWGRPQARRYAERIAEAVSRVGPRPIHLETSEGDPYREPNRDLSRRLSELGVPHAFTVLPGPHDQPWLREAGALEMLRWHDRELWSG
jgi:predicted esterase